MFKKILKGMLTLALFAVIGNPAHAFYSDMTESHWAYQPVKFLTDVGIVVGFPDGTYKPDIPVTRAEFASMAIKALGQEYANVSQAIHFEDINSDFWAYGIIQKAVYFGLIPDAKGESFRPFDPVTRMDAINIIVNALSTSQIGQKEAEEIVSKNYKDANQLPAAFVVTAAKAHSLDLVVTMPGHENMMEAMRPANRAEVAALLYKIMLAAKQSPNDKLAPAMEKRYGEGYIVDNVKVQGSIGIIPAGTIFPIRLESVVGSAISSVADIYTAKTPKNYVTKEGYLLIEENSDLKGAVKYVQRGSAFKQQGDIILRNELLVTPNDQAVMVYGVATLDPQKIGFWRSVFKGKNVLAKPGQIVNLRLLAPIKIDLTNGFIYE